MVDDIISLSDAEWYLEQPIFVLFQQQNNQKMQFKLFQFNRVKFIYFTEQNCSVKNALI